MPLSTSDIMALVSVIGAYIGILVALIVGVAQIRVQLRQQADAENTEEGHELLPNLTSLESLEHVGKLELCLLNSFVLLMVDVERYRPRYNCITKLWFQLRCFK